MSLKRLLISAFYDENDYEEKHQRIDEVVATTSFAPLQLTFDGQQLAKEDNVFYINFMVGGPLITLDNMYESKIRYKGIWYPSIESAVQAQKFLPHQRHWFSVDGFLSNWSILLLEKFMGKERGQKTIDVFAKRHLIGVIAKLIGNYDQIASNFNLQKIPNYAGIEQDEMLKLLYAKFSYPVLQEVLLGKQTCMRRLKAGSTSNSFVKSGGYDGSQLLVYYDNKRCHNANSAYVSPEGIVRGENKSGNYLMMTRDKIRRQIHASSNWDVVDEMTLGLWMDDFKTPPPSPMHP